MQNVMIQLSVSASDMTKANSTDSEKTVNSLRIYAFCNNRLAGHSTRGSITLGEPFMMDLQLPESGTCDVDFYVIANENQMAYESGMVTLSEDMTREQIESIRFTGLKSGNALPMYCMQTENIDVDRVKAQASQETGHEGHFVLDQSVEFDLTRSLAKISLFAARVKGATVVPQILNVELVAAGTRKYSYLFPQTDATLNEVISRPNNRTILTTPVDVYESVEKGTSEALDPSNYEAILTNAYLPEVTYGSEQCNQSSGNPREVVLKIEYALGEEGTVRTGFVYMPRIERNTHYKVCLLINAEGQLIINYTVADWDDNVMELIRFDYPTHSYMRDRIPTTVQESATRPESDAVMSEIRPFTGYFQMTYPLNDSWTPTLMGPMAGNCALKVYRIQDLMENEVPDTEWPISASEHWYKLVVTPDPSKVNISDEVKLAITYKASGFEQIEYLLINGSYMEYYWPYSGTSAQDANYVIITMVN